MEVVFSDNGNEVQYLTYTPYFYVPSPGLDPLNDKIVNINPTYVGILITAGGEYALSTIFSPSIFYVKMTNFFFVSFISFFLNNLFLKLEYYYSDEWTLYFCSN